MYISAANTMKHKGRLKALLGVFAFFILGFFVLNPQSANAQVGINRELALQGCKIRVNRAVCEREVNKCQPTNQTCLSRALARGGSLVYKVCRDKPNPQECHRGIIEDCENERTDAATRACRQRAITAAAVNQGSSAASSGASKVEDEITLSSGEDGKYQCGNGNNAVKTRINFGCQGLKAKPGTGPIIDFAYALIKFLSFGVGLLVAASIIYAGILYSTSGGNPEQTQQAKTRILNSLVGLIFYLLIFAFIQYLVPGGIFNP